MTIAEKFKAAPAPSAWRADCARDERLRAVARSMRAEAAAGSAEGREDEAEGFGDAVRSLRSSLAALADRVEAESEASAALRRRLAELERRLPAAPGSPRTPAKAESELEACAPLPDGSDCRSFYEEQPGRPGSRSILWRSVRGSFRSGVPAPGDLLEYALEDTVWDAAAIIGISELSFGTSAILSFTLLLNVAVQLYICYMLLTSESFVRSRAFLELQPFMEQWRLSIAHDFKQMDSTGRSLASRVCGDDQSLSVADSQASLLGEINAYLSLEPPDLEMTHFGAGPLLCSVCILLFAVLVFRELRNLTTFLLAVCAVPRGPGTRLEGGRVARMAPARAACIFAVTAARLSVALALLYTGAMWLSSTSSTSDLILNAAALNFIMDLDEHLFHSMIPATAQAFVRGLEPLRYRRLRWNLEAVVPLALTVAIVAVCTAALVVPNSQDMLAVKRILCRGNQDFVVDKSPAGFVIARDSRPFDPDNLTISSLQEHAVAELVNSPENTLQYSQFPVTQEFEMLSKQRLVDLADAGYCSDMDTFRGGLFLADMPSWFATVREETGLHRGLSLAEKPWACADHARFCQESGLLRFLCPVTCGCSHPRSGLLLFGSMHGCPKSCEDARDNVLYEEPCIDHDVTGNPQWAQYWSRYSELMRGLFPRSGSVYRDFIARKIANGCADNSTDPLAGHSFCDRLAPLMQGQGVSTVSGFCPAQCCAGQEHSRDCPWACRPLPPPPPHGPGSPPKWHSGGAPHKEDSHGRGHSDWHDHRGHGRRRGL